MSNVIWDGDRFGQWLRGEIGKNLEAAAVFLVEKIKQNLNKDQPYSRYVGKTGVYYKGLDPSAAGEFPHKLTGALQRSIAYAMSESRDQAFVGTNIPYGFYLEIGTSGMAARPYLRQTLANEQATIAKIIATGKR